MATSASHRQPVSEIESLTQLLEIACARASAVKHSDPAAYEVCVADVQEVIRRLSDAVATGWHKTLTPSASLN
jgi:hypothetical protein